MKTAELQEIVSKRAEIESLPPALKRQYYVNNLLVEGRVRSKVWLGFKIAATNYKRLKKAG